MPRADRRTSCRLDGILLGAPSGMLRIVVGDLCLDLDPADLVAIAEVPAPGEPSPRFGIRVRLELRRGAGLWGVSPGAAYLNWLFPARRPFAIACRTLVDEVPADRFRAQEKEFLRLHGLDPPR
ncbi:hypothetical protein AB0H34_20220 [Saccharopolyspora shandongensis]|uniref:hypothetical protein n=1 Tax=Saccharopolyspora shandongensis TaxID=418495 RepID=UPI0033EF956E